MSTIPASFFKHRGVKVEVSKLSKRYRMGPEEVHALRDTDWAVESGCAVAIMGPSGCGKTTLLNLLGGVDRPSGGRVNVDGADVAAMSERLLEHYRLRNVGFVFQFFNLIPSITAIENLELPMIMAGVSEAECRRRAETLLSLVGLEAKGQKRPEELSGGEQQRVAIARAIAKRPDVLLCDEPTGALDVSTGIVVLEAIERVNRELGTTTAVITHNAAVAGMADRVVSLSGGRIAGVRQNTEKVAPAALSW